MWQRIPGNLDAFSRLQQSLRDTASSRPIAMVGAGASAGLYPLWSELIRELANKTVTRGLAGEADRDYWIRIATSLPQQAVRCIQEKWGKPLLLDELARRFSPKPDRSFTETHSLLMRLPVRGYVTTNYDTGLTEARRANPADRVVSGTWKDDFFVKSWLTGAVFTQQSTPILHAHGTYERPDTIVISTADYREAYGDTQYRRLLEKLWGQDTLIFVGFGFSDRWLTFVAETVLTPTGVRNSHTARHFALIGLSDADAYVPDMRRNYHDDYDIEPIFYPVSTVKKGRESWEDHSALLGLLEALASPSSPAVTMQPLMWPAQFDDTADRFVRPLHLAENRFLQVLLSRFDLSRPDASSGRGRGTVLKVSFDHQTPTIWTRHAKAYLKDSLPDFDEKARDFQDTLEKFLIDGEGEGLRIEDASFMFRYASAGTLPVLRMGGTRYYCLFYRDVHPIGWNIANGGCDTLEELCNPTDAMNRELREELIVVDEKARYYFAESDLQSRPEFAIAEAYWSARFAEIGRQRLTELDATRLDLSIMDGPDELLVRFGDMKERRIGGVFLNINGLDFGIEIDKVVEFATSEAGTTIDRSTLLLCDGEVSDGKLLDRAVGLFDTERVHEAILSGRRTAEVYPDFFFQGGVRYDGESIPAWISGTFLPHLKSEGIRSPKELLAFEREPDKFVLCPVTAQIITRHLLSRSVGRE